MRIVPRAIARLRADRKAATAVEYGLILALVVLAIMGALLAFGQASTTLWNNVHDRVHDATGG